MGYTKTAKAINPAHPFGVSLGKIVINGNYMTAPTTPARNCRRHCGSQGLALTRRHFSYAAVMKGQGSCNLDGKRPLTYLPKCYLTDQRKSTLEVRMFVSVAAENLAKFKGGVTKICVVHLRKMFFKREYFFGSPQKHCPSRLYAVHETDADIPRCIESPRQGLV
jgi:hypothetical protein